MAEYSKSAIIKYTRLAKNMTQEELSQFICEPATLSRYENGQINPTNDKFTQLMQRMGETGELYTFPVQCETVDLQERLSKPLTIGFDARLVLETLKAFDCDNVGISLEGPKMPMIIEAEDSDFKTVVLPVAI